MRLTKVTDEEIIGAIQAWHKAHGETPRYDDWVTSGSNPSVNTIMERFGSWNQAMQVAGFPGRPTGSQLGRGKRHGRVSPEELARTRELYERYGVTMAARTLGITRTAVYHRLKRRNQGKMRGSGALIAGMGREMERLEQFIKNLEAQRTEAQKELERLRQAIDVMQNGASPV